MWTREMLKTNAKAALKGRYWLAVLVSFLTMLITSGSMFGGMVPFGGQHDMGGAEIGFQRGMNYFGSGYMDRFAHLDPSSFLRSFVGGFLIIAIIATIIGLIVLSVFIAYTAFIRFPVAVGQNRFYLDNRKGGAAAGALLSSFGPDYKNIVKVMFLKNLRVFLWSLLFVIPGIIKGLEYLMVDYLMAENPKMELKQALELSSSLTRGEKWEIFVLYLSFIGWGILCLFTAGIGLIFLNPYIQATFAELYTALISKRRAYQKTA